MDSKNPRLVGRFKQPVHVHVEPNHTHAFSRMKYWRRGACDEKVLSSHRILVGINDDLRPSSGRRKIPVRIGLVIINVGLQPDLAAIAMPERDKTSAPDRGPPPRHNKLSRPSSASGSQTVHTPSKPEFANRTRRIISLSKPRSVRPKVFKEENTAAK